MYDLVKAYLKVTLYFYAIMLPPFAVAWGLYFAGGDLRGVLESATGDPTGAYADCLVIMAGALAGTVLLRKRMKENSTVLVASRGATFSATGLLSFFLETGLTGVLGFGLFMALAFAFLPYLPDYYAGYGLFETLRELGAVAGFAERWALFTGSFPVFLMSGAAFGAFMWGTSQNSLPVKIAAWAAFIAFITFNPLTLAVDMSQKPLLTLERSGADIRIDSPVIEEALKE